MFNILKRLSKPTTVVNAQKALRFFATQTERAEIAKKMLKPTGKEKITLKANEPGSYSTVVDGENVTVRVGNFPDEAVYSIKVGKDKGNTLEVETDNTPRHWVFK